MLLQVGGLGRCSQLPSSLKRGVTSRLGELLDLDSLCRTLELKQFSMLRRGVPKMVLGPSKGEQRLSGPEPDLSRGEQCHVGEIRKRKISFAQIRLITVKTRAPRCSKLVPRQPTASRNLDDAIHATLS